MDLKNAVALVTGGASGLGQAVVERFHAAGTQVVIADRDDEKGITLANQLGENAIFVKTDVTLESDVQQAVQTAFDQFGSLRIVINCAGVASAMRVVSKHGAMPLDVFATTIQINLIGTFNVIRLAAEKIMALEPANEHGERGVIVNTASVAAFDGQIGQAAYSASKGGIVGMTLPIAREFAKSGIRVMTIAPGLFDTPLMASLPEPARISLGEQVPFPSRLGYPAEYAQLVQSIVENVMLNGEVIRLDGAIRMAPK